MTKQYSGYHLAGFQNASVRGAQTLGENIADNGGLKVSIRLGIEMRINESEPRSNSC